MAKLHMLLLLLTYSSISYAFQCDRNNSVQKLFDKSERVFLVYVTDTKLEEEILKEQAQKYPEISDGSEYVKMVSAGYRVVENFKGSELYSPRLIDWLGIGAGYVGLMPGLYYLVFLPVEKDKNEIEFYKGMRQVNICNVPFSNYRFNEEKFQEQLNSVRELRVK